MPKQKSRQIFIILWTILRIFAVALLWWNLLWGYLINIFLDAVDGDILERMSVKRDWYSQWDKLLDLWLYIFIAIFVYFNYPHSAIYFSLLVLFVYRLIGSMLFALSKKEWLLFLFPNVFTELFLFHLLFSQFSENNFIVVLIGITIFSLFKEWWVHLAKIDITNLLSGRKKVWK